MSLRWESPFSARGPEEVAGVWAGRKVGGALMLMGDGFDPRAPVAYDVISAACSTPVDVLRCALPPTSDLGTARMAEGNRARVDEAAERAGATIRDHEPGAPTTSSGRALARSLFRLDIFETYDEVIVDVSALPRSVYFPVIRGLLEAHRDAKWQGQLHVVACDNPRVDALVAGEGVQTPDALPTFSDTDPRADVKKIWVPVLGETEAERLSALYDDINPDEICPVLPFPAADPRRADELIGEYRELLFDRINVEPRNFIYADESNPFDVYRTLSELNDRYREALRPLGDTRMVLSAHSSKLLAVGVLLTAFEHGLEVRHASPASYGVRDFGALEGLDAYDFVVDLWLTGEPYE